MSPQQPSLALVILTWNASRYIPALFNRIAEQTRQPDQILVIDSSSSDNTLELVKQYPVKIHVIPQSDFNHGGTRQLATQLVKADTYIFMTQDAIPASSRTFETLLKGLYAADDIGVAYGRQLPAADANPLGAHLRLFNYPAESYVRTYIDKMHYGIKTCFNSNSFAGYKKSALDAIGGFPAKISLGEDVYAAAKMLTNGYKISYCADATVVHSHNFNLKQEFQRYFAIGQFHRQENWILEQFTSPTKEGFKYIASEIQYLIKTKNYLWLPRAAASWVTKFAAYKLGRRAA